MQHVWWKSLNPVNTLSFVTEVWMKRSRQVHRDGTERWRNQEEETIRQKVVTDSDCFSETPVWLHRFSCRTVQNHTELMTQNQNQSEDHSSSCRSLWISWKCSEPDYKYHLCKHPACVSLQDLISASGLWQGGLSSPHELILSLKKWFQSRISGHKGQALSVPALLLEP